MSKLITQNGTLDFTLRRTISQSKTLVPRTEGQALEAHDINSSGKKNPQAMRDLFLRVWGNLRMEPSAEEQGARS
jgi:hypothetical protein